MAREAIQALDKILQFNYQRDRARVQESLAFMQFAEQKRQNDIKVFSSQLETLGKANQQMKEKVQKDFISSSGLLEAWNQIPESHKEGEEVDLSNAVSYLSNKKKGGFSKQNAQVIANAMWASKVAKNHDMIVNLANTINTSANNITYNQKNNLTKANKNFKYVSDDNVSLVGSLLSLQASKGSTGLGTTLKQAANVKSNEGMILKEQFEFARGDTQIQSDFGMFGLEAAKEFQKEQQKGSDITDEVISAHADAFEALEVDTTDLDKEREESDDPRSGWWTLGAATGVVGGAAIADALRDKHVNQLTEGEKRLLDDYEKNRADARMKGKKGTGKNPFALNDKEFKEKYGFSKRGAPKRAPRKGTRAAERIKQQAYRKHTTLGKAPEALKTSWDQLTKDYKRGAFRKSFIGKQLLGPIGWKGKMLKGVAPQLAGAAGRLVSEEAGLMGEMAAGAGVIAGVAGKGALKTQAVRNLKLKSGQTFLQFLAKKMPTIGLRALAISAADGPLPLGEIAAAGLSLWQVADAYMEFNKLREAEE